MADNYLTKTTNEMYRWFDIFNEKFFKNSLEKPIITIQKTRSNTRGWFTTETVWKEKSEKENAEEKTFHEICISAQCIEISNAEPIEEIVAILLHEMCHYYNTVNGIKDVSGRVHNKKFAALAADVGLLVEKSKSLGWGLTHTSPELKTFILDVIKPDPKALVYYRTQEEKPKKEKEKKKKFRYVCPKCNKEFIIKSEIPNIMCGDCNEVFRITEEV